MGKHMVWIFGSVPMTASKEEVVQAILDLTDGRFGNLEAGWHEALPVASTGAPMPGVDGLGRIGVLLREDYAQQWYQMQDSGLLDGVPFQIDTSRPLFVDVLDPETGEVIGQRPNDEPYGYEVNDYDEQGNVIGTRMAYMLGPGVLR